MRSRGVFWIQTRPFADGLCGWGGEQRAREDPRTFRQGMDCFDSAGLRRQPERLRCNLQKLRRLAEIEPRLDPVFCGFVHRNTVMRASRGKGFTCTSVA